MENRINIAEILRKCQKGMALDCVLFDGVVFDGIDDDEYCDCPITIKTKEGETWNLTSTGCWDDSPSAKCVIFPKGKTTWKGFIPSCQFKNGDVVATSSGAWIGITTGGESGELIPTYCVIKGNGTFEAYTDVKKTWCFSRFATKEERQKLFDEIKAHGYTWNSKTKTLEEITQPKFKIGAVIQDKDGYKVRITEVNIEDECYGYESMIAKGMGGIAFKEQDDWKLVPNKFDITTLKPFDKVLVRDTYRQIWSADFFSHNIKDSFGGYAFACIGHCWHQCIPYKENEYLLGKTDGCQDFYKTWE